MHSLVKLALMSLLVFLHTVFVHLSHQRSSIDVAPGKHKLVDIRLPKEVNRWLLKFRVA